MRYSDTAFVTVATRNYAHRAYSLMASVAECVPDAVRLVCCADGVLPKLDSVGPSIHQVDARSLNIDRYFQLVFCLNATAICCMLKPFAVLKALQIPSVRRVVYLDNDVVLYETPDELLEALNSCSIVLTPHHLKPLPKAAIPGEEHIVGFGIFNAGLFGVSRKSESVAFLNWWSQWMLNPRRLNQFTGYDQLWLNYVPVYCNDFSILRGPGYNVAYWNIIERKPELLNEQITCLNQPLVAFHFSNFDEERNEEILSDPLLSNYPRGPATRWLANSVMMRWNLYREYAAPDYKFNRWDDGTPITDQERQRAKSSWNDIDENENPWKDSGADSRVGPFASCRNFVAPTGGTKSRRSRYQQRICRRVKSLKRYFGFAPFFDRYN